MSYIHIREYYSAIKKNEVLAQATTWVSIRNVMFSERNQTSHIVRFHSHEISRIGKHVETESTFIAARGWGKGRMGVEDTRNISKEYKLSFGGDRSVLELNRGAGCATL